MLKKILNIFRNRKLTADEKSATFIALKSFVKENPVQIYTASQKLTVQKRSAAESVFYNFSNRQGLSLRTSVFGLLLLFGGTLFAAQSSLPGEGLYAIKINVNEPMETFAAFGTAEKATILAKRIVSRLTEAETLATNNKLSDTRKAEIENQLKLDLEDGMKHINTLTKNGEIYDAALVKTKIYNSFRQHKEIINDILSNKAREPVTAPASPTESLQ